MASRVEELLEQILAELINSRIDTTQAEGTAQIVEAAQKKVDKPGTTGVTGVSGADKAKSTLGAIASGDSRNLASSLASNFGGAKTATAVGLGVAAVTAGAQRGYNQFNRFEKFDRTTVEPYKKLENIVMEYGRYGKSFSEEQITKMFEGEKAAQERGFKEVEKLREIIDTSPASLAIKSFFGNNKSGGSGNNGEEEVVFALREDAQDKSRKKSEQAKKMQKSVNRNDKYEDNY